jgi:hypothetical protein
MKITIVGVDMAKNIFQIHGVDERGKACEMENFDAIFREATMRIGQDFFLLLVEGGRTYYRERVYCYELYHQIRALWPDPCAWSINGEVDKGGHLRFEGGKAPKPDFLVHIPGEQNNYVAIEVKAARIRRKGLLKDISTLRRFLGMGYPRTILLIYGLDPEFAKYSLRKYADLSQLAGIEIWVHPHHGEIAHRLNLGGPLASASGQPIAVSEVRCLTVPRNPLCDKRGVRTRNKIRRARATSREGSGTDGPSRGIRGL